MMSAAARALLCVGATHALATAPTLHDFGARLLEGTDEIFLSDFSGRPVLVMNVAAV